MNQFPSFNPNEPALNQLSANRMNLISLGQKSNQIQPGIGYRTTQTPGGTTVSTIKKRTPSQDPHPFKMFSNKVGSEVRLYIQYGRCTTYAINADGIPVTSEMPVQFEDEVSDLSNDEFGLNSIEGYSVLDANKTYGVWVVASQFEGTPDTPSAIIAYTKFLSYAPIITGAPWVYVTDVSGEINYGDGANVIAALTSSAISLAFYIGQVITDDNAVPAFKQWRKTDIFAQLTAYPNDFVVASTDANNSIIAGTDGLPFVPPIVSSDTPNDITTGTDGGALYDAP